MLAALVALPFLAGTAAFFIYSHTLRRLLLVGTALAQLILVALCWFTPPPPQWGVLALDAPGLLVLTATAVLFLAASCYAVGYFHREGEHDHAAFRARLHFANVPEAIFTACLLFFLGAATLVAVSQHLGLMWAAVEATPWPAPRSFTFTATSARWKPPGNTLLSAPWALLWPCWGTFCLTWHGNPPPMQTFP